MYIESIHYACDPKISLYDINLMLEVSHSMVCSCKQTMLQHLIQNISRGETLFKLRNMLFRFSKIVYISSSCYQSTSRCIDKMFTDEENRSYI